MWLCMDGRRTQATNCNPQLGMSPLILASRGRHQDVCDLLARAEETGPDLPSSLHRSAAAGHYKATAALLKDVGVDPNLRDSVSAVVRARPSMPTLCTCSYRTRNESSRSAAGLSQKGKTPIHYAAKHNRLDILRLLVLRGGNINAKDTVRECTCHVARLCEMPGRPQGHLASKQLREGLLQVRLLSRHATLSQRHTVSGTE